MFFPLVVGLCLLRFVWAYIPASPTNSTQFAIAGGLNITDISALHLKWYSNGSYTEHVSYQLAGNGSSGISKGVLVHFSEEMADNYTAPTLTPWIALVSCDKNATNASMEEDIFTLARDKGAVSALLFSLHSTACVINPEYSDPATFDQVFDIFSTQSGTSSHLIEYQFGQLSGNKSLLSYDSAKLNNSGPDIIASINQGVALSPGYLLATLQSYNAIDNSTGPANPTADATSSGSGNNPPNTALAMIILYAITGCVSALFCVVIISGAIRAIRHPERYGPRARMGGDGGPPQSRARGLTRAILDTFPIVKFGSNQNALYQSSSPSYQRDKDAEMQSPNQQMEMGPIPVNNEAADASSASHTASAEPSADHATGPHADEGEQGESSTPQVSSEKPNSISNSPASSSTDANTTRQNPPDDLGEGSSRNPYPASTSVREDVVPASIGRETCPICIVDFEEGDDIRVLPCEGKHCFHQNCVDPWLLKLSSSCPICRHDFLALEHMISGTPDDHEDHEHEHEMDEHHSHSRGHSNTGRFSRYLRFAHRRQRRRGDENDPTDPYMPTAPDTSMYPGM